MVKPPTTSYAKIDHMQSLVLINKYKDISQGATKIALTLKGYNFLQPPSIFLILSMDCRTPSVLSTLLIRTYLSVDGVVCKLSSNGVGNA